MTTLGEIYDFINEFAPFSQQQSYDNSGICVGDRDMQVKKILTALDITSAVVREADEKDCQLVLSHHPVIFRPLKTLSASEPAVMLAARGIAALCMHTSYDSAAGGMNDLLAEKLGLEIEKVLDYEEGKPIGYVCTLKEGVSANELARRCKNVLGCKIVRFTDNERVIKRVAICSGSGGSMLNVAMSQGCDALITGDVKHSDFVAAGNLEFCLIDAGHFYTENIFHADIAHRIKERFPEIEVCMAENSVDVVEVV